MSRRVDASDRPRCRQRDRRRRPPPKASHDRTGHPSDTTERRVGRRRRRSTRLRHRRLGRRTAPQLASTARRRRRPSTVRDRDAEPRPTIDDPTDHDSDPPIDTQTVAHGGAITIAVPPTTTTTCDVPTVHDDAPRRRWPAMTTRCRTAARRSWPIFDHDQITLVAPPERCEPPAAAPASAVANSQFPDRPVDNRLPSTTNVPVGVGCASLSVAPTGRRRVAGGQPPTRRSVRSRRPRVDASPSRNITDRGGRSCRQRGATRPTSCSAQRRADAVVATSPASASTESRPLGTLGREADLLEPSTTTKRRLAAATGRTEFILYGLLVPPPAAPAQPAGPRRSTG